MKKKFRENGWDAIPINQIVVIEQEFCAAPQCKYEKWNIYYGRYPMHAYPGGTPSCRECAEANRNGPYVENSYGNIEHYTWKFTNLITFLEELGEMDVGVLLKEKGVKKTKARGAEVR